MALEPVLRFIVACASTRALQWRARALRSLSHFRPLLGRTIHVLVACGATWGGTIIAAGRPDMHRLEFKPGAPVRIENLPASRLRTQLERLPPRARERATAWLGSFHFTEQDLPFLHVDGSGAIYYADDFHLEEPIQAATTSTSIAEIGALPTEPLPASLLLHSRPGAPNVLYLNFAGETVANTAWNTSLGRSSIPALPFSLDSDYATFSEAEQLAIRRIWQRVAEDYAPFDINVTTERPETFTDRTAHALITRNTDADGAANPASTSGGVAYVNVFGTRNYGTYRPAWIYSNNLGGDESYIAEAVSHEIGHNMGLSHDGRTDGSEYYSGHGSGDTSWGPIMGTAYNRHVTQWSRGEYYLASNTQDDLATLAGKTGYRPDDHGNTFASATPLLAGSDGLISSTTPESDPENHNPANKGVIERPGDADFFSFATGSGQISLQVDPWISPSGRVRGGNLDLLLELYDVTGQLVAAGNPASQTHALIETTVLEGVYYLAVRNTGVGDPLSSNPSGYTAYGSLGQYFISGSILPSGVAIPPGAEMSVSDIQAPGTSAHLITVTYTDNVAIDVTSIASGNLLVTGPNTYEQLAELVSIDQAGNGTPRTAIYSIEPPPMEWDVSANGTYTVSLLPEQVRDTEGIHVPGQNLGSFKVAVPKALYFASMDTDPGWTLTPSWQYGVPNYNSSGPSAGYTGTRIIGYNLSGYYQNRLSAVYATTPVIDASEASSLTLRFRRWLRLRNNDTATIEASINGTAWSTIWSTTRPVSDSSWQEVQYSLPDWAAGSATLQLRWGIASNPSQNDIGWNIDDVEILGDGEVDTTPPVPVLSIATLTVEGSPTHSFTVTYTDDTSVRLASLDSQDILVTGPNGYSTLAEFAGADRTSDGSPLTATYAIPAPAGIWSSGDNGTYTLVLVESEVQDSLGNSVPETLLGSFSVAIPLTTPGELSLQPGADLMAEGSAGGPFTPSAVTALLSNGGGSPLNWSAESQASWVNLSPAEGTLAPGESAEVTIAITGEADLLPPGEHGATVSFVNVSNGLGNTSLPVLLTIHSPAELIILTESDFNSSGVAGGTFAPASHSYTVTNSGGGSLAWSAEAPASWLELSPTEGTLAPGESAEVTIALTAEADLLPAGEHGATVSFVNVSNGLGNTSRPVLLTIHSPAELIILTESDFNASGVAGGPFAPSSHSYTLTNSGGWPLDWAGTATVDWLSLSTTSGTLEPGEATVVTVQLGTEAEQLPPGHHSAILAFEVTPEAALVKSASAPLLPVTLRVVQPGLLKIIETDDTFLTGHAGGAIFSGARLYTLTNSGGTELQWSASSTADWLNTQPSNGLLEAGAETTLEISASQSAGLLEAGTHTAFIYFTDESAGMTNATRTVTLTLHLPPILTADLNQAAGELTLQFAGISGEFYRIEASDDLQHWELIAEITAEASGEVQFRETHSPEHPMRFYRAIQGAQFD